MVPCPYCNHPHCDRHGQYFRKGTHVLAELIGITRYRCPPCRATHSILPKGILPICRWRLGDILDIAVRLANGETPYAIAKQIGESLASLRRLKSWLAKALDVIAVLARELGFIEREPTLELVNRWPTWLAFTHAFSRTLYPKRFPLWISHMILTG